MKELILVVLLSMPPFFYEPKEAPEARKARLEILAEVLTDAKLSPKVLAGVLTIGELETHYARYIAEGRCAEGRFKCDPDKNGVPQARTYFQLWRATCPQAWSATQGSPDELRAAVSCAAQRFKHGLSECRGELAGAFSFYRHSTCSWHGAKVRVGRYLEVRAKLQKLRLREKGP